MKKYPIYSFAAKWAQDGEHDPKYPNWHKGLPEGRTWNSTSMTKMCKEEKTEEELKAIADEWWEKVLSTSEKEGRSAIINPKIESLTYKLKEHETWDLSWFQHETFDVGQTNEEVLKSFEEYVRRAEEKNREIERQYPEDKYYENGHRALMGAEDRWRWHGAEPNGESTDHSPAPCRCKFCKEQGVIRIAH